MQLMKADARRGPRSESCKKNIMKGIIAAKPKRKKEDQRIMAEWLKMNGKNG